MSRLLSPSTNMVYGVRRVCLLWDISRSSYYGRKRRAELPCGEIGKRGPKTNVDDEELLGHIREDLTASPFVGEGHRKVWARLRFRKGVVVGHNRVLRLMREHRLLSPHRSRPKGKSVHDRKIVTSVPNVMWGTDASKILTVQDGWTWCFCVVDHWNAECMGCHVSKRGDRFAALEPVAQGLTKVYGHTGRGLVKGLSLRMDHGNQYTSRYFREQIKSWGIAPSFAFVEEPQTNGVIERFFKTLKQQVIYGRVFRDVEEVRSVVRDFVELYNEQWLIEKNGYKSPAEVRREYPGKRAA